MSSGTSAPEKPSGNALMTSLACRSTGIEVALKMAMRKYMHDRPGVIWKGGPELHVVGLTNGYHGDTLGAMDAVAQSPYNDFNQTPW